MTCPRCGLPDLGNVGDGIGSCDCSRCDCCGAGPDDCDCDCRRDWEDYLDDDDGLFDPLCNDPACDWRRARAGAVTP